MASRAVPDHVDVVIVGAGLSGIGAASILKRDRPDKTFVILESRGAVGGTWDLFRYPGVRSDSDMHTLGFSFRPWTDSKSLADGEAIRDYILGTVDDEGLSPHILLNHRVVSAEWHSADSQWTVTTVRTSDGEWAGSDPSAESRVFTCSFLYVCSGYYRYDEGHAPTIPGAESFEGTIVHPQHWPEPLDWTGKRVVVIGSGATAVTLVPSMAETAAHVTMLQRSPTYIAPVASHDRLADLLRGRLPVRLAYQLVRLKNIAWLMFTYRLSRRRPDTMKAILRKAAVDRLPADFAIDPHLTPSYEPWDQRLCLIPDADLFRAISGGTASIVTDRISEITAGGIRLSSGAFLDADLIVTATGLQLLYLGGMTVTVDGTAVDVPRTLTYKGMMLSGVPNFAMTIGYTNATWTLKADLVARYVARLLRFMDRRGYRTVTPHARESVAGAELTPLIDLKSGYVLRDVEALPKQGAKTPWRLHQNYARDFAMLRAGRLTDAVRFGFAGERTAASTTRTSGERPRAPLEQAGTQTVTVDGARIRYRITGEGPPILLLHGIGQSLRDWDEQHELLARRHRVHSLDLPGFAYSDRLPGPARLDRLTDAIPAFLDAVGVTTAVPVIGHSLGGAVAMSLAVRHPDRVRALVLVDSAGFGQDVTLALRLLTVKPLGAAMLRPRLASSRMAVRTAFADQSAVTDARIAHAYRLSQRRNHRDTMLDLAGELGTYRGVRTSWREDLLTALAQADLPILILWGDRDRILPFTQLAAAASALPHARTHVFESTGHMPQIERADEFAEVVEGFLADADSPHRHS